VTPIWGVEDEAEWMLCEQFGKHLILTWTSKPNGELSRGEHGAKGDLFVKDESKYAEAIRLRLMLSERIE
jgi:hypothetical protein